MSTILNIIDLKLLKRQVRSKITYRPKFARNFVFQLLVGKRSTLKKLDVHLKFGFLEKANVNICSTQRLLKANVKGSFSYDYPETLYVQRQEIHPCKNVSLKLSSIFFSFPRYAKSIITYVSQNNLWYVFWILCACL